MATSPERRVGPTDAAAIIDRCQRLSHHIRRTEAIAADRPSYHLQASLQKLRKQRRALQALIRPRLATSDGEAVS